MLAFLCKIGFHAGPWVYTKPGACDQHRFCVRPDCGKPEYKPDQHDFRDPVEGEEKYAYDDSCWALGVCRRCGNLSDEPVKEIHLWGPWQGNGTDEYGNVLVRQYCQHCPGFRDRIATAVS